MNGPDPPPLTSSCLDQSGSTVPSIISSSDQSGSLVDNVSSGSSGASGSRAIASVQGSLVVPSSVHEVITDAITDAQDHTNAPSDSTNAQEQTRSMDSNIDPCYLAPIPSQNDYIEYIKMLQKCWQDSPRIDVVFNNLTYIVPVAQDEVDTPNIGKAFMGFVKQMTCQSPPKTNLSVFQGCSGTIPSGEMTLILAPPGAGKSQFLKALSGRLRHDKRVTGDLWYNGLTADEQLHVGFFVEKLFALVAQGDVHFSNLTVRETLQFALESSVSDPSLLDNPDPKLIAWHKHKADLILSVLGLHECADTIVGDAVTRGISGGQKKRLTIGELMITNARLLLLDEPTTGLDAAVARDIMVVLREWCEISGTTVVAALLQPTPECYELYDNLILMREGVIVYQGPREDVYKFIWEYHGIECDPQQDIADFLIDWLTDPKLVHARQLDRWSKHGHPNEILGAKDVPICRTEIESDVNGQTKNIKIPSTAFLRTTNDAMTTGYRSSPLFVAQSSKIDTVSRSRCNGALLNLAKNQANSSSRYTQEQFSRLYARPFVHHTVSCLRRQFILLRRDTQAVTARLFSGTLISIILGSLFLRLGTSQEDNFNKIGMMSFALMSSYMGNFSDLPAAFEGRNTVYKHLDAGMYPPLSYMFSVVCAWFPVFVIEMVLFSIVLYFMVGLAEEAGRYFFFFLMLLTTDLMLAAFYRLVCYTVATIDQAQQVINPAFNLMLLFCGFLITRSKIPVFLIEFYWISPLAWSLRSLVQNEFYADTYGDNSETYLDQFEVPSDKAWKFAGFGYEFAVFIMCVIAASFCLVRYRFDLVQGTKRISTEELVDISTFHPVNVMIPVDPPSLHVVNTVAQRSSRAVNASMSLPFLSASLTFKDVHYTVKVNTDDGKTADRKLLNGISAYVKPGQCTALMGASGAGKTTLLDVIAGRKTTGVIEGEILVNGLPQDPPVYKRITAYIEQRDVHSALISVRESLMFSAFLRLPNTVDATARRQFVDEIIDLLELRSVQDRIIGNTAYVGLSTGQLKLVTIGVELVANPSILFLDEPTSGLDSRAALVVMRVIKNIAATGRTVLCTIHQPSVEVFSMFDQLLLLRSGGETAYFGSLGSEGSHIIEYFESDGQVSLSQHRPNAPVIPKHINPASWMLDVIGAGVAGSLSRAQLHARGEDIEIVDIDYASLYPSTALGKRENQELNKCATPDPNTSVHVNLRDYEHSCMSLFAAVLQRGMISAWRDSKTNFGRIITLTFLGTIYGLIFLQVDDSDYAGVISKMAACGTMLGFGATLHCNLALQSIIADRAVYYRERANDSYPSWMYSLSLGIVEIPFIALSTFGLVVPFYFMIGWNYNATDFFQFWCAIFLLSLVTSSFGQWAGATFSSFMTAVQASGTLFTFWFLFGGVFMHPAAIPQGWKWFYYLNPIPKAFIACLLGQFHCDASDPFNNIAECPSITLQDGSVITTHRYINEELDAGYDSYPKQIAYLIACYVFGQVMLVVSLKWINHLKR